MSFVLQALTVVVTVLIVSGVSNRYRLPAPLLLVVVGVAASFLPFLPEVRLDPEVVLIGVLPPLLYAAAIRSSLVDFQDNRVPIFFLSVGLVVFTALGVGLVAWWLLPIPFAAAFALGAVVAPPDAVAATAIGRRIGLPRRLITLLEGESLINDATALVCLSTAVAAITGKVTVWGVAGSFLLSTLGGLAVGLVVAVIINWVHRRFEDSVTNTSLSLITPFVAFLPAQAIHASGVLAVVIAGLVIAHKAPRLQTASARVAERTNWRAIQFLLENAVFLVIGLQMRGILTAVSTSEVPWAVAAVAAVGVLAAVIFLRPLWVFPARFVLTQTGLGRSARSIRVASGGAGSGGGAGDTNADDDSGPVEPVESPDTPWTHAAVLSWAGMRGVVTLAAAFILPQETPHRQVLVLIAMVVAAGTLLLQGSTLPILARRLSVRGPDPREDALQEASVMQSAVVAGLTELDRLSAGVDVETIEQLRRTAERRTNVVAERLGEAGSGDSETPSQAYRRIRMEMLAAEREAVLQIRDSGQAAHEVLEHVMNALDMEESMLGEVEQRTLTLQAEEPLELPVQEDSCRHLQEADNHVVPLSPNGCEECLREGTEPVNLRLCLECGHVGCDDTSEGRHAEQHYHLTGHPVMRSFEPGETWRWCYIDKEYG